MSGSFCLYTPFPLLFHPMWNFFIHMYTATLHLPHQVWIHFFHLGLYLSVTSGRRTCAPSSESQRPYGLLCLGLYSSGTPEVIGLVLLRLKLSLKALWLALSFLIEPILFLDHEPFSIFGSDIILYLGYCWVESEIGSGDYIHIWLRAQVIWISSTNFHHKT